MTTVHNIRGKIAHYATDPAALYVGRTGLFGTTLADLEALNQLPDWPDWIRSISGIRVLLHGGYWGNPYRVHRRGKQGDGPLEVVLQKYERRLLSLGLDFRLVRDRKLLCWCCDSDSHEDGLRCHAQVIARHADGVLVTGLATATLFGGM